MICYKNQRLTEGIFFNWIREVNGMLQDIAPKKLRNEYDKDAIIENKDYVICVLGMEVLCKNIEEVEFPTYEEFAVCKDKTAFTYLFSIDGQRYFLYKKALESEVEGCCFLPIRSLMEQKKGPKDRVFAAYTAKHLYDWYRDNQYCGRCGVIMKHSESERCMVCECGYHSYPRIMPAVIVGVINKDKLLLTRYREGYRHNALIAGFTEIGETVEETVEREVMEEAGIKVKNIKYYKSQPWGSANDILLGFFCDVDGDDHIHMDEEELRFASWVEREQIELQPDDISLTNEMMKIFKSGEYQHGISN